MSDAWTRRKALTLTGSALAFGLAGCTKNPGNEPGPTSNPSPSAQKPALSMDDLTFDVQIHKQITADHPLRLRAELSNESKSSLTLFMGTTPPFTEYLSDDEQSGSQLIIIPELSESLPGKSPFTWDDDAKGAVPTTPTGGCWQVTQTVGVNEAGMFVNLEPGESLSRDYDVYAYQSSECFYPGTYRFEHETEVERDEASESSDSPSYDVTLGFELVIHDDRSITIDVSETVVSEHVH